MARNSIETSRSPDLIKGNKYFLPHLGEVLTYYGRGSAHHVAVNEYGNKKGYAYIFGKLGGILQVYVTKEQAEAAEPSIK
jgi:hypothetical protein